HVFPALFRKIETGQAGETVLVDTDATCFYHTQKKAVVPCDGCGRFLCALCDMALNDQHLCPRCLESGAKRGKMKNLQNRRIMYDSIALSAAILPLLVFYLTFITAPLTLYWCARYWKAPGSLVPRTKVRFVIAAIVATLQIGGWLILLAHLVS
ncbi:MAG TPA: hypothetical protein VEK08_22440, partial [Planctomycetota bacterium]|nr:hypothetical protein [Planctomycetota bacterium]